MNGGRRKARVRLRSQASSSRSPCFSSARWRSSRSSGWLASSACSASTARACPTRTTSETYVPIQESVVYDRTGTVELARFRSGESREVVTFDQIPPILIDAVTSVEDKTFWTNTGFDPVGVLSAVARHAARQRPRRIDHHPAAGPPAPARPGAGAGSRTRTIERKIKEIIQSVRVTEAYPGDDGKQRIITAYLNQNYYGNGSYGIKAAARGYFGVDDLNKLTLGQVALLAALPAVASSLRPGAQRRGAARRPAVRAARSGQHPHRRAAQLHPRHARRRTPTGAS